MALKATQTSPIHSRCLRRSGHWKQNCLTLKERKILNSNHPRPLIIGRNTPKLFEEKLDTFYVPL